MERLVDFLLNFYGPSSYLIVFGILLSCGLGLPIPEDITLFAAGLLAYYGIANVWTMIAVAMVGVLLGDSVIFLLGARYGRRLTKKWFFHKLLPEDRLKIVGSKFRTRGNKLIFVARFMPGLRAPIYFSAGTLHLPYTVFILYDSLAAMISVPAIIGAVFYFGDELDRVIHVIQRIEHGLFLAIAAVAVAVAAKWYLTHRKLNQN